LHDSQRYKLELLLLQLRLLQLLLLLVLMMLLRLLRLLFKLSNPALQCSMLSRKNFIRLRRLCCVVPCININLYSVLV
jgi:hypothetical protein